MSPAASYPPNISSLWSGANPSGVTPCSDGERLYVFFGKSGVYGLDLDGEELWHVGVGDGTHGWGSGTSPVLFGNLLAVSHEQLLIFAVLVAVLAAVIAFIYRPLLFASVNAEVAEARGVPVRALSVVFMVLLGLAVTMAVQAGKACMMPPDFSALPARNWNCTSGLSSSGRVRANRPIGAAPIISVPVRPSR